MSRAPWVAHFGLTRTPFPKAIAAKDLFSRDAHAEAVARINFCVSESALGVLVGDVGAGKTVAVRAAVANLDLTSHHVVYVANPAFGTRGLYVTIVSALGGEPRFHKAEAMAQASSLLAAEEAERHRRVVLVIARPICSPPPSSRSCACSPTPTWTRPAPSPASSSASPCSAATCAWACSPPSTSASPPASACGPWTWPSRPATSATTWPWLAAPIPSSRTTPWPDSTGLPTGCPVPSTTRPSPPWAAASAGKALVDDACARKAVAELTRD